MFCMILFILLVLKPYLLTIISIFFLFFKSSNGSKDCQKICQVEQIVSGALFECALKNFEK